MNGTDSPQKIGRLLLDAGKLKLQDIDLIVSYQKEHGLRFGEAAVKLGLVVESDIQQMLAQQFNYPYLQPGEGGFSGRLTAAYQPFSNQVESIRNLRSQLVMRWFDEERKQLALAGLGAEDSGSILAANLAVVFSQMGQRTILVDANLRNPRQHQLFNLPQSAGLSEMLAGHANMEAICKIPHFADLSVLTSGALPPNPQELLGRPAFKLLMGNLSKNYDIILLDTPNGMLYADTQMIVTEAGAALLVMDKNQTRMNDALALQAQLADINAHVVGAALNEF